MIDLGIRAWSAFNMLAGPLPNVPLLSVCASVTPAKNGFVCATGIGATAADARLRHDSEREERIMLRSGELHPASLAPTRSSYTTLSASAAGRDGLKSVLQRALFELNERRACRLWWSGELPPSVPRPSAQSALERCLARWPRLRDRQTGLIELDQEALPPVYVCWSCDKLGLSLCFGAACSQTSATATEDALKELYQMEFGLDLIRHKEGRGIPLSAFEQRMLERSEKLADQDLGALLDASQHAHGPELAEPDVEAGLAMHGLEPKVRVFERHYTLVHVQVETSTPDLRRVGSTAWSLYGTDTP